MKIISIRKLMIVQRWDCPHDGENALSIAS